MDGRPGVDPPPPTDSTRGALVPTRSARGESDRSSRIRHFPPRGSPPDWSATSPGDVRSGGTLHSCIPRKGQHMTLASREAPFGAWKSPLTAELIASQSLSLGEVAVDGEDVYWLEVRANEGGRHVIVRRTAEGTHADLLPAPTEGRAPYSARSLVYGRGGGSFTVSEGLVVFVNHASGGPHPDQRLYRVNPGRTPVPITPDTGGKHRYAD